MKFFKNLPKTSFASLSGDFIISDFFTYLDVNRNEIDISTVNIDNKTTLIEAAYVVYTDVNSFWAFVAANQTVNPFDLLSGNSEGDKSPGLPCTFSIFDSPKSVNAMIFLVLTVLLIRFVNHTSILVILI